MNDAQEVNFDKESVYDEKISPLVDQIIEICESEKIPLFISVCYKHTKDDGDDFCDTLLKGDGWIPEQFVKYYWLMKDSIG